MNVRLYDGTVRCPSCFDASSYESDTTDPCLYCALQPDPDDQWLNTLSILVVDQPRRTIRLDKNRQCDYCCDVATWTIDHATGVDRLCTDHGQEWHPELFPLVSVA